MLQDPCSLSKCRWKAHDYKETNEHIQMRSIDAICKGISLGQLLLTNRKEHVSKSKYKQREVQTGQDT